MAATITHTTVAVGTDAGNGEIRKAQWNEAHAISGTIDVANGGTGAATARIAAKNLSVPYVFAQSGATVSVGAVTTEEALATITIPGGAMGANGWVTVIASWDVTNSANTKTLRIRAGGVSGTVMYGQGFAASEIVTRVTHILNTDSETAQHALLITANAIGYGNVTGTRPSSTVDTTADWDLVITGQKTVSGETISLRGYQVIIGYGA